MNTPESPQYHYEFVEGDPLPLADIRAWVRACLLGRPAEVVADALLLVTELASNAYEHGGGTVGLRLSFPSSGGIARFEVDDRSDRLPPQTPPLVSPEAVRGRGLMLVASLSTAWGVVRGTEHKTVWAEIALG
jgi:anti-sigma regulatory factor (Ser/Thr protein kinase)